MQKYKILANAQRSGNGTMSTCFAETKKQALDAVKNYRTSAVPGTCFPWAIVQIVEVKTSTPVATWEKINSNWTKW